ncbi:MAG: Alpha-galactosidase precursor [Bacteroidetes bacterium]|nr:Alpha-galactosidase precursor [Bacteroidota bacterium]
MNKRISVLLLSLNILMYVTAQTGFEKTFQNWAITPPMGWNSWDCFGPSVVESEVKSNADYMAAHLKQFGWEYIVVDIRWYVDNQTSGTYNAFNNSTFVYDEYGRYLPSPKRFPSSVNGAGFKPLADYIHSKGLKFGIHIMRGVPKVAVNNRLPIKNGNGKTAADIYSTASECTWLHDNYTIVGSKAGAQEYYNSILELYASWGVDFIKIDDLSRPYHQDEIELIRKAIDNTGRPIVLSMSPGATPLEKQEHVKNNANMWRTVDDFWDNWSQLNYSFAVCASWAPYISPGSWADADMLPLGHIAIRGERGVDRQTNFTRDEQYTLMTLWSVFKSPLMFGGHLPDNKSFTDSLITNREVLDMHKRCVNSREWLNKNDMVAWTADDPDNGDKFLALFNNGGDGYISTKNILYRSGTISRLTDGYGVDIDITLPEGSTELYLVVNDGGDGITNDHADWINPTLYNNQGDSIKLTTLNWVQASAGWGTVSKNLSISGKPLNVLGKTFSNGVGTHSRSVILYSLPAGYNRFKCFAGLDKGGTEQSGGATVEFFVSNQNPTLRQVDVNKAVANSGLISRTYQRAGKNITANIAGAQKLYLVVTDAGDNFNYDHADWINTTIYKENGDSLCLTTLTPIRATSGWDVVKINKSLNGNTLKVNGKTYTNGFGVNSYSTIEFNLPEGYTTFKSFCGFDDEVLSASDGVTVEFMVFTENPAVNTVLSFPVDLAELGYASTCKIRDMWSQQDLGTFEERNFISNINYHGAKLYRISANNRSEDVSALISASSNKIISGDSVLLNVTVKKTGETTIPSGSLQILRNDTVVGVLHIDSVNGNPVYKAIRLAVGSHTFTAKYSGNTLSFPVCSNTITVEVVDATGLTTEKEAGFRIIVSNGKKFITGLVTGDTVSVYNTAGQLISTFRAESTVEPLRAKGAAIVKVNTYGKCVSRITI